MMSYSIFLEKIKKSINGNFAVEIHDWDIIKDSITKIINDNIHGAGRNIVDFIDLGNWDFISSFSFDDSERRLELIWHPDDKFHIYIESAVFFEYDSIIYAFLKGYYNDKRTLNKIYNTKCTSCNFDHSALYMTDISRIIKRTCESIQTPNINCYTTCISTRPESGVAKSAGVSRHLMDSINMSLAYKKIDSLYSDVHSVQEYDRDTLQEKGNTARRYLEYILKLVSIRLVHLNTTQYQEEMLGSLVSVIHKLDYKPLKHEIKNAIETLNACSHHGGTRIKKTDVISSLDFIKKIITGIEKTDINKLQLKGFLNSIK